jgi:hypothetical protein
MDCLRSCIFLSQYGSCRNGRKYRICTINQSRLGVVREYLNQLRYCPGTRHQYLTRDRRQDDPVQQRHSQITCRHSPYVHRRRRGSILFHHVSLCVRLALSGRVTHHHLEDDVVICRIAKPRFWLRRTSGRSSLQ